MQNCILIGRTTMLTSELKYTELTNNAGQKNNQASISFNFAVDRPYKAGPADANGRRQNPTDYIHCRATGPVAETFAKYCTGKKADGKLMSRHLSLQGRIETYTSIRNVEVPKQIVNINGQQYEIAVPPVEVNQTNYVFVVTSIEFLDSVSNSGNAGGAVQAQATVAQPVAQPVATQASAMPAPTMAMPVEATEAGPWS
jgi:uncharacterized OB-fold protein